MTHRTLFDISPMINPSIAVFPGDTVPSRETLMDMQRGDHLTLSTLHTTVHVGAHVDAPSHYGRDAESIERVDLGLYLGSCRVISAVTKPGERVPLSAIPENLQEERVIVRTESYPDPQHFKGGFAGLDVAFLNGLADRGVRLVGLDTPSVDPPASKDLPAHQACLARGVVILEGLVLTEVPDGRYELIALPLKLEGFDGSPVRAVLRSLA